MHHRRVIQLFSLEPEEELKFAQQRQNMGKNLSSHLLNVNSQYASFPNMGISRTNFQKADLTTCI